MFELKHLKSLASLKRTGSVRKTAEVLFISQSALSHQLKDLEHRLGGALFIRNTSPIQFTKQGEILLNAANKVLPEIEIAQQKLKEKPITSENIRIAMSCHACFQWLVPVLTSIKKSRDNLNFEFVDQDLFYAEQNKNTEGYDLLFTDELDQADGFSYQKIGEFEVIAACSKQHLFAEKTYLLPKDLRDETLLTYPINSERLDAFKLFLTPAKSNPKAIKHVQNSHMMLQMVAGNMGVAFMPDWLIKSLAMQSLVNICKLTKAGIYKTLYVKYHKSNINSALIKKLIPLTVNAFSSLYHKE